MILVIIKHSKSHLETFTTEICQQMRQKKKETFDGVFGALTIYSTKKRKYIEAKNRLFSNVKQFQKGRKKIIEEFKNRIFPSNYDDEEEDEQTRYEEEETNVRNENALIDCKRLQRLIDLKNRGINDELVMKYFQAQDLGALLEKLKKSKNNTEKNEIQVALNNSGLRDLREEIEDMTEQEKKTKTQMLSRLPTSLAQLKARNNSEKLKNEIR